MAVAVACGHSGASESLQGIERPQPLDVSGVTLPELHTDTAPTPFLLTPPPGHLLFVYFGYTHCPDLCPTTLATLQTAVGGLDPDQAARVDVAMVTVDPERDTADVFVPYLQFWAPAGHALGTSDPGELEAAEGPFQVTSSVTKDPNGDVVVSHTATSYVVTPDGKVAVEWPFGTSAESMRHDLAVLLDRVPEEGST